ncbi:MAG: DMT family transporter [Proteobacteria bacterium]|nr:DMT family transporter [Pseudomonadota bacterium]
MHKENVHFDPKKLLSGIIFMLMQAMAMSAVYVLTKTLTRSLHTHQVAFMYKFAILLAILPWCFVGGIRKNLRTRKIGMHVTRGTFSIMGSLCFFYGLSNIDVLDAAAITYMEHIIIVLIGVMYFRERLNAQKIVFIVVSFIGALLVIQPGFKAFNKYYVYIFLALIFWAINNFAIKVLGRTEHTKAQLFYGMLISSLLSFPLALHEWRDLQWWHFKFIAGLALCYLVHLVAFFKAFKYADISTVMPFDYSRLIFTGVLGYLVFGELPDEFSYIGYCLIVLSGLYFMQHEARRLRIASKKLQDDRLLELESKYEQV